MKKLIFALLCTVFVFSTITKAQNYTINKLNYDHRMYAPQMGDYYNPGLCGVASFLVPGLGQIVAGETGRGLAFMGGYVGGAVLYGAGYVRLLTLQSQGFGTMLLGFGAMVGVSIWSITDAVKVAKVNNLYLRDKNKLSTIDVQFAPYVSAVSTANPAQSSAGMSLRVRF